MDEIKKQYFTIGEVQQEIPVSYFCIHQWCKLFSINTKRDKHLNRKFTPAQFLRLKIIYILLRVERYSIDGAKIELGF